MRGRGANHQDRRLFQRQVHGSATEAELRAIGSDAVVRIEARGTFCPEPVIRMQDRLRDLVAGQTAMLLADDTGVEVDIPAWCISTGNEYLGLIREPNCYRVFVRKS